MILFNYTSFLLIRIIAKTDCCKDRRLSAECTILTANWITMSLRPAIAYINLNHLKHNYQIAKQSSQGLCYAVVKANAYGHGLSQCVSALSDIADGFAVACIEEAIEARELTDKPLLVLQGAHTEDDWHAAAQHKLDMVLHHNSQLSSLNSCNQETTQKQTIWLKINTGMNRLGFAVDQVADTEKALLEKGATIAAVMSHYACADDPNHQANTEQQKRFALACSKLEGIYPTSFNNSAAIMHMGSADDLSRAGIMLYGSSPLLAKTAEELKLKPVMTLESEIIALNPVKQGESVGYGHTWSAPEDGHLAIITIGYGDGYPRHLSSGDPVVIQGQRYSLAGRVSMDMIAAFIPANTLTIGDNTITIGTDTISIGTRVELWGEQLSIDEVAKQSDTIGYELMCQVTPRIKRIYID